jgi:hypothetical protein
MKRRVSSPQVPEPPPQTFSRCIQVGDQLFVAWITANSATGIEGGHRRGSGSSTGARGSATPWAMSSATRR